MRNHPSEAVRTIIPGKCHHAELIGPLRPHERASAAEIAAMHAYAAAWDALEPRDDETDDDWLARVLRPHEPDAVEFFRARRAPDTLWHPVDPSPVRLPAALPHGALWAAYRANGGSTHRLAAVTGMSRGAVRNRLHTVKRAAMTLAGLEPPPRRGTEERTPRADRLGY